MQERPLKGLEVQRRSPTLNVTVREAEKVLRGTLGVEVDFMGRNGPAALSFLDRDLVERNHRVRLVETNALAYEMDKRGLPVELISHPSIVEPVVIGNDIHLTAATEDFIAFDGFTLPARNEEARRSSASKAAVRLFDIAAIRLLEFLPMEIPFEDNPELTSFMRNFIKDYIKNIAAGNEREKELLSFAEEFDAAIDADESRLIAKGAQIEYRINHDGKDLKVVSYPPVYQNAILEQLKSLAEAKFVDQMYKRQGPQWFIKPETSPIHLGVTQDYMDKTLEFLVSVGIDVNRPEDMVNAYLYSELAVHLGIHAYGLNPILPASETAGMPENVSGVESTTVIAVDEDRELKKMLRKERKAEKKKKNNSGKKTNSAGQGRFNTKTPLIDEGVEIGVQQEERVIVRPDIVTVQNARIDRLLANKARKQAGAAKREARENEARERAAREEKEKQRLERQRLRAERPQTGQLNGDRRIGTVHVETPLQKALREANAKEVVLKAEEERILAQAQEEARIKAELEKEESPTAVGMQVFSQEPAHEEQVLFVPAGARNEDADIIQEEEEDAGDEYSMYEDEDVAVKFQPILKKKKYREF